LRLAQGGAPYALADHSPATKIDVGAKMTGSLTESTLRWRGGAREPVREEAAAGKGEHMDQSEPTLPAAPKPLPPKQTPRAFVLATALGLALGVLVSAVIYDRVLRAGPVVDDDDEFAGFARYTDPNVRLDLALFVLCAARDTSSRPL
jgi:hypothetical protein